MALDRSVELDPHVFVFAGGSIRRHEQEATRHAEMHEPYDAPADVGEKVFRATRDPLDRPPDRRPHLCAMVRNVLRGTS